MGMSGEETPIHEKSQKTLANSQDEREQRDERIVQGTRSLEIKDPLIRTWSPPLNRPAHIRMLRYYREGSRQ